MVLSRKEFLSEVISKINSLYLQVEIKETLPFGLVISYQDNSQSTLYFENIYGEYWNTPEKKDEIIENFLKNMLEINISDEFVSTIEDPQFALPRLKPLSWVKTIQEQLEGIPKESHPIVQMLESSVAIAYVLDNADLASRVFITNKHLEKWNISLDDLTIQSRENLFNYAPVKLIHAQTEDSGSIFNIEPKDEYGATRILLTEILEEITKIAGEDLILAIPKSHLLIALPSSNEAGINLIYNEILIHFESIPDGISDKFYRFSQKDKSLSIVEL